MGENFVTHSLKFNIQSVLEVTVKIKSFIRGIIRTPLNRGWGTRGRENRLEKMRKRSEDRERGRVGRVRLGEGKERNKWKGRIEVI